MTVFGCEVFMGAAGLGSDWAASGWTVGDAKTEAPRRARRPKSDIRKGLSQRENLTLRAEADTKEAWRDRGGGMNCLNSEVTRSMRASGMSPRFPKQPKLCCGREKNGVGLE